MPDPKPTDHPRPTRPPGRPRRPRAATRPLRLAPADLVTLDSAHEQAAISALAVLLDTGDHRV